MIKTLLKTPLFLLPLLLTSCRLNIVLPEELTIINTKETLVIAVDTYTLSANVLPENTTDKSIAWNLSNENAKLENGVLIPLVEGSVILYATSTASPSVHDEFVFTIVNA